VKPSVIQFANWGDSRNFGLGDKLSGNQIVTGVDNVRSRIFVRPATKTWRALMWLRTAPMRTWRWVVFKFYSLLP